MKKIISVVVIFVFILSMSFDLWASDKKIEIYTFQKDRVDQNLSKGNRGYLTGKPMNLPENARNSKRKKL